MPLWQGPASPHSEPATELADLPDQTSPGGTHHAGQVSLWKAFSMRIYQSFWTAFAKVRWLSTTPGLPDFKAGHWHGCQQPCGLVHEAPIAVEATESVVEFVHLGLAWPSSTPQPASAQVRHRGAAVPIAIGRSQCQLQLPGRRVPETCNSIWERQRHREAEALNQACGTGTLAQSEHRCPQRPEFPRDQSPVRGRAS